ncbi:MAG: SpoIIE family protein phosphatase, partial [Bacteroidota bacterium]
MKNLILPLLFVFLCCFSFSQHSTFSGKLFQQKYTYKDYSSDPQNWAAVSDCRGIMYFANSAGIVEFDGEYWRLIMVSNHSVVRSFAVDDSCNIYVGASGEFGMLVPGPSGDLQYRSMMPLLTEPLVFEDVWIIHTTDKGVYFHTEKGILRYHDGRVDIIKPGNRFHFYSSCIDNEIYVQDEGVGLIRISGNEKTLLPGTEALCHVRFDPSGVFSFFRLNNDTLLFLTHGMGMFVYNGRQVMPWLTEADDLLSTGMVCYGTTLIDGKIAIGTILHGCIILNTDGSIHNIINTSTGLVSEAVYSIYSDPRGILWLMQDDGIARLEYPSPFSYFGIEDGVPGTIEDIMVFMNEPYLATHAGAAKLTPGRFMASVKPMALADKMVWNFQAAGNLFMASTLKGLWMLQNGSEKVEGDFYSHCLYVPRDQDSMAYIGVSDGLVQISLADPDKWNYVDGIKTGVSSIVEYRGGIWMGSQDDGIFCLTSGNVISYDSLAGIPPGYTRVNLFNGNLYARANKGDYIFDEERQRFFPDSLHPSGPWAGYSNNTLYFPTTSRGSSVYIINEAGDTIANSKGKFWGRELQNFATRAVCVQGDVVWLGGIDKLVRYNHKDMYPLPGKFPVSVRKVIVSGDSVLFNGTFLNGQHPDSVQRDIPVLDYINNKLRFEYAGLHRKANEPTEYSYRLEGYDESWSHWSTESHTNYTSLHEGDYTFMVKARNRFGDQGQTASYSFVILAPWYRTIPAYIGYFLLFAGLLFSGIRINNRRLIAAKIRLERIVEERTEEIRQQREEIRAQRDLAAEQRDLIALQKEEITDSINYAFRIQSAVIPSKEYIAQLLPDSFILYKPRDIVSGDFYWIHDVGSKIVIVAADCTGHGVPGAFMSMLGVAFLNEIVKKDGVAMPDQILNRLREEIIQSLKQTGREGESKDGMDVAAFTLDAGARTIWFAGANNPLYMIRNGEIVETKGSRMPVAIHAVMEPFIRQEILLEKNDTFYVFSDGYADQFGGPKGKKFKYSTFKELLLSI